MHTVSMALFMIGVVCLIVGGIGKLVADAGDYAGHYRTNRKRDGDKDDKSLAGLDPHPDWDASWRHRDRSVIR